MTKLPVQPPETDDQAESKDGHPIATVTRGARRILFFVLAGLFFILGVAGAILPVLPATPFLLLTSYFLIRTSPRLNAMLLRSRFFGPILTDWQVNGGVRRDVKVKAIVIVLVAVALTIFLTSDSLIPALIVTVLAAVGIGVILFLPTAG